MQDITIVRFNLFLFLGALPGKLSPYHCGLGKSRTITIIQAQECLDGFSGAGLGSSQITSSGLQLRHFEQRLGVISICENLESIAE